MKGYNPGGTNWKLGKGKPSLNPEIDLYKEYKALWVRWAKLNPELMEELRVKSLELNNGVLSDVFASTEISQARALSEILNGDLL